MALVTSGAVTAMINVLKVYLVRDKSLVVEFENPDGRKVKLSSNNVKPEHLKETMASLKDVMGAMS